MNQTPIKRLMRSVLRLHPLLEDQELRLSYEECEIALGYQPKKTKCLMRNSGITLDHVKPSFTDELKKADIKYYFDAALDWSDANNAMKVDWIATIRGFARRDLREDKLKISKQVQDGGTNLTSGKPAFEPAPVSKSAMTREEWKQSEEYKRKFK